MKNACNGYKEDDLFVPSYHALSVVENAEARFRAQL